MKQDNTESKYQAELRRIRVFSEVMGWVVFMLVLVISAGVTVGLLK